MLVCKNGNCIDGRYKCDGEDDCRDGTDESDEICGDNCGGFNFPCINLGKKFPRTADCIDMERKCDGFIDCEEGKDELKETCAADDCGGSENFRCKEGYAQGTDFAQRNIYGYMKIEDKEKIQDQCIIMYDRCDGRTHCKDGEDEKNCDGWREEGGGFEYFYGRLAQDYCTGEGKYRTCYKDGIYGKYSYKYNKSPLFWMD